MKQYTINDICIREDGYVGQHGWYWQPSAIASIVFRAFRDSYGEITDTDITVCVSDLEKQDAGNLSSGCHDVIYSVFVKITSGWPLPTAEQVHDAYKNTNAQFNIESIHGGYHFYKTW